MNLAPKALDILFEWMPTELVGHPEYRGVPMHRPVRGTRMLCFAILVVAALGAAALFPAPALAADGPVILDD